MKGVAQQLEELKAELAAQELVRGKSWKGYKVFIPIYSEQVYVGLPLVVLVNDEGVRLSTPAESFEYLDFENAESNVKSLYDDGK